MKKQLELFPTPVDYELSSQEAGSVESIEKEIIVDAEWCFQFFNNEPIVFAYSNENEVAVPLNLKISPEEGEGLTFQQNGMTFRVFPRPISEETKLQRTNEK